jgi:hypothetical protein
MSGTGFEDIGQDNDAKGYQKVKTNGQIKWQYPAVVTPVIYTVLF